MQHLKPNVSDKERRKKMYAPKESNLSDDAFADDVNVEEVGIYLPKATGIVYSWGTLGNHHNHSATWSIKNEQG
tara:strand:+ start:2069 stop:2290 length:222 start_codon:yes stop_codon:yes gene_type:complete